jgi:ATP-dependent RNA helicase HelY
VPLAQGSPDRAANPVRRAFLAGLGFALDPFQVDALDALDDGHSVLVAAPTGSGKTVVAAYAVELARAAGAKAFYTTPLKALSNQKYAELVAGHGPDRVGLLTGDNSINGKADVVVMTTEVLRNMIYSGSPALARLRYVVLDEVHYLQNPYRGAVWEEVIIHLPPEVDLVCLSATVSNAEDFADWITTVRGNTRAVIEERRPVELRQLYMAGDRSTGDLVVVPTFVDGRPNPDAAALDARDGRTQYRPRSRRARHYTPRRTEVVERLAAEAMLPAIYFIFSRAACDDAVRRLVGDGVRLTTSEERHRIRAIAETMVESLSDADLRVLGYGTWLSGLEAGVASHHAGLVPPFKEAVEACFAAALVKVVFATETLSLGINMPARSVVIERLTKFSGERHEYLTPGEYTQLTGRAGRRGIDDIGYAAVLWSPFVDFATVAGLASTRAYALRSSFRPTYNMAANLVRLYQADQAHHLLNLSFAQYLADAEVVRLEAALDKVTLEARSAREDATCDRGDLDDYLALERDARRRAEPGTGRGRRGRGASASPPAAAADIRAALARIKPGDVLVVPGRVAGGRVAVVSTARRRGGEVRLGTVTVDTRKVVLGSGDFDTPPAAVARVDLPTPYQPSASRFLRQAAAALRDLALPEEVATEASGADRDGIGGGASGAPSGPGLETTLAVHPVGSCPELAAHRRAHRRAGRLEAEMGQLEAKVRGHGESLARQFDRVLRLLRRWGYVGDWELTPAGERLARLYHEADLLVAEALERGLLDGLDPPGVAALVSAFTYEPRGPGTAPEPRFAAPELKRRWQALASLGESLGADEDELGLPRTRTLDPGFVHAAHAWASGAGLHRVVEEGEMSGGDFVRNVKQLVDLLRQVAEVAPDRDTAKAAKKAADEVFRGVVAASSEVRTGPAEPP